MLRHGKGYGWANHEVHSEDGYILNLFRLLPPGVERASDCHKCFKGEPVFFMHGMGGNASRWINRDNMEIDSIPIALMKQGYDVWLGNARGNHMSKEHETLDWKEDEKEFWNYSFPEMAKFDLPAMLETVYEESGGKKINYIGMSLGTTQIYYALSNSKVKTQMHQQLKQVITLAPIMVPQLDDNHLNVATYLTIKEIAENKNLDN